MKSETIEVAQRQLAEARANKERETLRDMIAITALGGIISRSDTKISKDTIISHSEWAYEYADAMLRTRVL